MNSDQLDHMRAVFFLLEETAVVREAVEDWQDDWAPWGPFESLDQFVQAWNALALQADAFSSVGFYVLWDSLKDLFPESLDSDIREYPPEVGDLAVSVLSSVLREDGLEDFTFALEDYCGSINDDGQELVSEALPELAQWWDSQRGDTLAEMWRVVSALEFPITPTA